MKKNLLQNGLVVLVAIAPLIYLAIIWSSVPSVVALHFNGSMKPDRLGDKEELWLPTGIIALVSVGVYFLFRNITRFDPKQNKTGGSPAFNKLATGLVLFLAVLNFIIISSSFKGSLVMQTFLFPMMGLLFAFLGNYMNNIKPNYFAGFRLPWTLSSDDNWRSTHQLAGKVWFAGGLLIAILSFIIPSKVFLPVFIGVTVVMVIIPVVHSYRFFRENSK